MRCFTHQIYLIFLFIILNFSVGFGQEIEWQNTIGGSGFDKMSVLSKSQSPGYICGGGSFSNISGDKTENSLGDQDYWVIKLDLLGNIQWQNTIGGYNKDRFDYISPTPDGGYICGGTSYSDSSYDKTENSIGIPDYWILKLDNQGNIQWQNTIGGTSEEDLRIIFPVSGGYICGGSSYSDSTGDKTENSRGDSDYWIIKLDLSGNILWQKTIGGSNTDYIQSLINTSDGGYLCAGHSFSNISGDKTENNIYLCDFWLIKLDGAGNIQWQNTIGSYDMDQNPYVMQTTDGGYICGGTSFSGIGGDKTENSKGSGDYWIVKLDATGNIQWQKDYGGNDEEYLNSIIQTSDGGYICGGFSKSNISGDKTENSLGSYDYWILKLDGFGNIQWQNTIGGTGHESLSSIFETLDGGYVCGGTSDSNLSGDKSENSYASKDYWIVKLTSKYNSIQGKTFLDINSNFIQDNLEPSLINNKVIEQYTGRFAFSNQNGSYNLSVLDTGNFTVFSSAVNYYNHIPVSNTAIFTGVNQIDSLNDFAFQPTGAFNDLCITITPLGPFRSGFNASYLISYENVGTTSISGDVIFFPFSNVTFLSSNVIPASITPDSVVWTTGVLIPFQTTSIVVTVNVNAGLPIGTLINSSVRIEPVAGDANPGCNYHSWEVYTIGSYDPNDILVSEDTLFTTQFPNPPYLDYIIRFQNTGNDTAFTVKILNPIDTNNLELSSIEFVNSSHPVNLNWTPWERNMEFKFSNILLPDSNVNEPMSHGFVHYRIKPKTTLLAGDSIANNAYIYFDFNMPVATNTAVTKIVLPTGIHDLQFTNSDLKIFPNPAKDEITISIPPLWGGQVGLTVFNVMGKQVLSQSITNLNSQIINLKSFASGVYYLQLNSGKQIATARFVKM